MPKSFLLKRYIKSELKPDEEPWTLSASLNDSWVSRRNMNGVSHIPEAFQFETSPEKNGIENREEDTERLENNGNVNHQINTADAKRSLPREKAVGTERKQIYESQLNSRTALVQPSKLHRKSLAEDLPCKPPYRCDQCGKIFKTKYTLTIHLKMPSHTGARPFVCGVCGKGFRLSSTLCRHKIIHTSDKPHKCNICQKAFNRSSTLKTHVRTHSETKEFTCDLCGKGFHQKGNLRNHTLIHTGEKPYKCTLCEKAFNKLSNLKFHLHVHTDNAPYRCRHCKVHFSRRCDLKEHISARHKNT